MTDYHAAFLVESKRLRILLACDYDHRQALSVERMLVAMKLWPSLNDDGRRS